MPSKLSRSVEIAQVLVRKPDVGTYDNGTVFVKLHVYDTETNEDFHAVGNVMPTVCVAGLVINIEGNYEINDYGRQFKFKKYNVPRPAGRYGTIAFLKQAPGIGERTAINLWELYQDQAIDMLIKEPAKVQQELSISINITKLEFAGAYLADQEEISRIELPLRTLFGDIGFPKELPKWIVGENWSDPVGFISECPFRLMAFPRVGFTRCDKLRKKLGLPKHMPERLRYATEYALQQQNSETWLSAKQLKKVLDSLLSLSNTQSVIAQQVKDKVIVERDGYYALGSCAYDERRLAYELSSVTRCGFVGGMGTRMDIEWPTDLGNHLTEHQKEQSRIAFQNGRVVVLLGGAGTGKTTTAAAILDQFDPRRIVACAPTGKAAQRLTEAMREHGVNVQATTAHKAMDCRPIDGFFEFALDEFVGDILVVDELGTLTNQLGWEILSRVPDHMLVLLLGDPYQLPPVGRGTLLRDWQVFCDKTGKGTYGLLTEIHRNEGHIVQFCDRIRSNQPVRIRYEPPPTEPWADPAANIKFVYSTSPQVSHNVVKSLVEQFMAGQIVDADGVPYPADNIQVICAVNKDLKSSKDELNITLQDLMNPTIEGEHKIYRPNDRVMCVSNHYVDAGTGNKKDNPFIANGDIGRVVKTNKKSIIVKMRTLTVSEGTGDGKGDYDLAYACTCHKMQGDQAPVVIVVADNDFKTKGVTSRQWLYTAVTRAQSLCIVVSSQAAIDSMKYKDVTFKRKSFLIEELEKQEWDYQESSLTRENRLRGDSAASPCGKKAKTSPSKSAQSPVDSRQETTPSKDTKTASPSNGRQSRTSSKPSRTTATASCGNSKEETNWNNLL